MSYFAVPRLHFSGSFRAAPSTLNNVQQNFAGVPPLRPLWNPKGSHDFQLLRGTEFTIPPGANVTPCTVRGIVIESGDLITDSNVDPLIGTFVVSANTPSNAKLVDLDPNQQQVSEIWGMQLSIGGVLIADYETAYFQQLFGTRAPGGFAIGFSAAYQSVLTRLQWPDDLSSPLLRAWKTASPDVLSIRFTVDRLDATPVLPNGAPNPNFTIGRITGTIGPGSARDPVHVTLGRMLRPAPQNESANAVTAVVNAMQAESKETLSEAMQPIAEATPPNTNVNFAPARVDASRNILGIDLANALPFDAEGNPQDAGTIEVAIDTSDGLIPLGTIANTLANYEQRAFLFELPLGSNAAAARENPIVVLSNGVIVLSENDKGAWIDADEHVYRMDASGTSTFTLYATTFGETPAVDPKVTLAVSIRGVPRTAQQPLSVSPQQVTLHGGSATVSMFGGIPGNRRGPVDGQVYRIDFDWNDNVNPDPNAYVSVHVYDAFPVPATPQWSDVQPVLAQIMFLYPFMQTILNLGDESTVVANAALIARFMRFEMTDPHFMPVTRDLSGPKTAMILQYLDAQGGAS